MSYSRLMKTSTLNTILIVALTIIAITCIVGIIVLSVHGKPIDNTLIGIVFTVVGALAGVLRGVEKQDPKQDTQSTAT